MEMIKKISAPDIKLEKFCQRDYNLYWALTIKDKVFPQINEEFTFSQSCINSHSRITSRKNINPDFETLFEDLI